jgi:DNA topoisomerase II
VIAGQLVVSNRKKTELLDELHQKGFKLFSERKGAKKEDEEGEEEEESPVGSISLSSGYDYLLSMKIWSLTMERVKALTAERDEKRRELDVLTAKTAEDLWLEDLDCLEIALGDFEVGVAFRLVCHDFLRSVVDD